MKKTLKIFLIFLFAIIFFSVGKGVEANTIQKISMDIYINENGDAQVTETWKCKTSQGTEVYHPYYNLGKSVIKDLSVTDENTKYTTLSSWNTSGTLSSKANKCGINKISNGVELCWGISSYGTHTYTAKYTITNFVSELTDSQMVYWTLIPYDFSTSIGQVYIKIHTNFNISSTTDVWGYGNYGGTAYVYNGYIEMQSAGSLATNEYMTILVKFPSGTFNTKSKLNHDFNYYFNMAEEGSTKYVQSSTSSSGFKTSMFFMFVIIINMVISVAVFFAVAKIGVFNNNSFNFGSEGKKIPKDIPYYRDIPCKKDLFRAYFIANQYGLTINKSDVLGAIILKWIKDGLIKIEQKETGMIFKKENTVVVLTQTNPEVIKNEKEQELFIMLYEASRDGYLESKEFERWCRNKYNKLLTWFDKVIQIEKEKLVTEGLLTVEEKTTLKVIKTKIYTATPKLKQEAIELAGLKKYLNEYTLIKDREAIEVKLFEEYLIYAQIMGIAKKVAKQFKDLYPEIIEQSNFYSYDNIIFIYTCSSRGITEAYKARSRAESYSSGGGGFSSGGGGGGSFGGGGGGGGFR